MGKKLSALFIRELSGSGGTVTAMDTMPTRNMYLEITQFFVRTMRGAVLNT